jgi:hypothetical protein
VLDRAVEPLPSTTQASRSARAASENGAASPVAATPRGIEPAGHRVALVTEMVGELRSLAACAACAARATLSMK